MPSPVLPGLRVHEDVNSINLETSNIKLSYIRRRPSPITAYPAPLPARRTLRRSETRLLPASCDASPGQYGLEFRPGAFGSVRPTSRLFSAVLVRKLSRAVATTPASARIARALCLHNVSQARIDRPVDKRRASHPLPQAAFKLASFLRQSRLPIALKQFGKVRRVRDEPLYSEIGLEAKRFPKLGLGLVLLSL